MKKIAAGAMGIILIAILYYFSLGSSQLTNEFKSTVDQELTNLQSHGFSIEDRTVEEKSEHFVLVFDDTDTITNYLNAQGAAITVEEAASLKGLKFGVDLDYLKDAYSSISFDLYPTALPDTFSQGDLDKQDKEILSKLEELLTKRTFLVHVDINKLLDGFKGSMKDIDERFGDTGEIISVKMESLLFTGDIKEDKITSVNQTLKSFLIHAEDELDIAFSDIKSRYILHGPTTYDTSTDYSIEKILFNEASKQSIEINKIKAETKTTIQNDLAESMLNTTVESVQVNKDSQLNKLSNIRLDMSAGNLDIKAFEQLQQINMQDDTQIDKLTQQILSRGPTFKVSKLSVEKLHTQNQDIQGFDMDARFEVAKDLDLTSLQTNPMLALASMSAHLNLNLSESLHTFLSTHPQALIAMMMFQPKDENGKKVYQIILENGTLSVNGVPMQ